MAGVSSYRSFSGLELSVVVVHEGGARSLLCCIQHTANIVTVDRSGACRYRHRTLDGVVLLLLAPLPLTTAAPNDLEMSVTLFPLLVAELRLVALALPQMR